MTIHFTQCQKQIISLARFSKFAIYFQIHCRALTTAPLSASPLVSDSHYHGSRNISRNSQSGFRSTSELHALVQSDWEQMARLLADICCRRVHRIVVMAGAGVSTASGIPDFRSPLTGLYAQLNSSGHTSNSTYSSSASGGESGKDEQLDETAALIREVARKLPYPEVCPGFEVYSKL